MTTHSTQYTPLESLLLFHALRHGAVVNDHGASFTTISESLNAIPLVRDDPSYDRDRLSPDALRDLYLTLLKEEVKLDLQRQQHDGEPAVNGDLSPGSRKRKAASPSLPTVREAAQHSHLIPQLVNRLYARYRERTVRDIRGHERRYGQLAREIGEIEAGRWDERLKSQQPASVKPSTSTYAQSDGSRLPGTSDVPSPKPFQGANGLAQAGKHQTAPKDAIVNHVIAAQNDKVISRGGSPNLAVPPLALAPKAPHSGNPGQPHPFSPSSPAAHPVQHPSQQSHTAQGVGNPLAQNAAARSPAPTRPFQPPPRGGNIPPPSGELPVSSMHGLVQPQLPAKQPSQQHNIQNPSILPGTPTPQPSLNDWQNRGHAATQSAAPSPGHQQPQPPPQDRRAQVPARTPQQQPHPAQGPQTGGFMLPPFQVAPQDPAYSQQGTIPLQQQQTARPQPLPNNASRQGQHPHQLPMTPAGQRLQVQPHSHLIPKVIAALATPPKQRLWKSEKKPPSLARHESPPRPDVEPLSPRKLRAPSPAISRAVRNRELESVTVEVAPSSQPKRGTRRSTRQAREGSIASSTVDGSVRAARSQSVASIDEATAVAPTTTTTSSETTRSSRRRVKPEPSTPAEGNEETDDTNHAPASSTVLTRKRRGTLQSQPTATKRSKRTHSLTPAEDLPEDDYTPPTRPGTVTATRNFAKMCSTIMNDILSHKHGSRFALPVRVRDAEGYSEIIKRPQDMKSIRAAITSGARAIAAAASVSSNADSPSTDAPAVTTNPKDSSSSSSTVELERSIDLIPPKAIVNGAQLEREVMHMLANAVMFNPGEDGMVSDTREMFEDVEAKIREWRGTEREIGDDGNDGGMEEGGKTKRRKL